MITLAPAAMAGNVARSECRRRQSQSTPYFFHGFCYVGHGRNLWNAHACNDTSGADGAWAYTHFDAVCARLGQCNSGFSGGNVAANHFVLVGNFV